MNIDENKIFQKAMFLAMEGQELTTEQVESLEHACSQNPDGLDARFKLLGYYFSHSFGSSELKALAEDCLLRIKAKYSDHPDINDKLGHLYKLSKMKQHQPGSNSPLAL